MERNQLVKQVGDRILSMHRNHPVRVGINGIDASGKTLFSNELASYLSQSRREIIQASIDGFHNSRKQRYQKGRKSPEGYYHDSFNLNAIRNRLLDPLGQSGNLQFVTEIFSCRTDSFIETQARVASPDAILLMDGIFLFQPQLTSYWDFKIFLQISFETLLERALIRDGDKLGTTNEIEEMYKTRYMPGQKLYLEEAEPIKQSNIVIDNNDVANPEIVLEL